MITVDVRDGRTMVCFSEAGERESAEAEVRRINALHLKKGFERKCYLYGPSLLQPVFRLMVNKVADGLGKCHIGLTSDDDVQPDHIIE